MAMSLLNEFGANNIRERGDEIEHSCVLPFGMHPHGDRSGSASFNWRKMAYNCFVCGGGGLAWFVSTCRGESFTEGTKWVEKRTTFTGDEDSVAQLCAFIDAMANPQWAGPPPPIPHYNPAILKPWMRLHWYMTEPPPLGRGVPVENCVRFKVGYNEQTNRIVFPVFWKGELVGWQTRRINDDGSHKYILSPDFPRSRTVYNYETEADRLVIVESQSSVVSKCHLEPEFGLVGTFGKSVSKEQLILLRQRIAALGNQVTIWFDNDYAGWEATGKVAEYLLNYADVWVVDSPWNGDAGDLDDATTLELLRTPVPYAIWTPPREVLEWKGTS
jgi:hypothetical protein